MCDEVVEEGFFNMDLIRQVCESGSIKAGKELASNAVNAKKKIATADNVRKALNMIDKCRTIKDLGISMTNFMFAHPSENLKTIR